MSHTFGGALGTFTWRLAESAITLSPTLAVVLGSESRALDGRADSLLSLLVPADRDRLMAAVSSANPQQRHLEHDFRIIANDGSVRWFTLQAELHGEPPAMSLAGTIQPIPTQLASERRMRAQQAALFQLLTEDRLDTLSLREALERLTETLTRTLAVERASVWLLEAGVLRCLDLYRASERIHESGTELRAPDYPAYFKALAHGRAIAADDARSDPQTREFRQVYLEPRGITSMLDATVRRRGLTIGVVCNEHVGPKRHWTLDEQQFAASVADVVTMLIESHERRDLLARVQHQARHDGLTGLPNRVMLRERLERLGQADGRGWALLVLDLDEFSEINDTLGHDFGDQLIAATGRRLEYLLPDGGLLARLGGDEFALLVPVPDERRALEFARLVQARIRDPLTVEGVRLSASGSVGVSLYPRDGSSATDLLRCADVALYHAKKTLRGCQVYSPERDRHSPRRLTLMHDFLEAVESGRLSVVYQPKIELASRRVVGVEALARWNHPRFGPVGPSEFVPLAEMSDGILGLTLLVIARAGDSWREWRAAGIDLPISINLSAQLLSDQAATAQVLECIRASEVPPDRFELEITEDAFMDEPDGVLAAMRALREAGIHFGLDDFGVGYSSLTHLSRMPIRTLKIDKSFVQRVNDDPKFAAIVQSAAQLGRNLGLVVVGEGVETEAVAARLAQLGCEQAQGFLFARPMPGEAIPGLPGLG